MLVPSAASARPADEGLRRICDPWGASLSIACHQTAVGGRLRAAPPTQATGPKTVGRALSVGWSPTLDQSLPQIARPVKTAMTPAYASRSLRGPAIGAPTSLRASRHSALTRQASSVVAGW